MKSRYFINILTSFLIMMLGFSVSANSDVRPPLSDEHQRLIKNTKIGFKKIDGIDGFLFDDEKSSHQVIYLFSYSCPFCYMFTPYIQEWSKNLRDGVAYYKIPVSFADGWDATSNLYYISLELGLNNQDFDSYVYSYIHEKGNKIESEDDVLLFFKNYSSEIDKDKILEIYRSEKIESIKNGFDKVIDDIELDGTPSILIINRNGDIRLTSPAMAGGEFNTLFTVEYLIFLDRKASEAAIEESK